MDNSQDLQDTDLQSDITKDQIQLENIHFDLNKLKVLGILQCDGDTKEKVKELYNTF